MTWQDDRDKAIENVFGYLANPEFEDVVVPEVVLKDGTRIPQRTIKVLKTPDFVK